MKINFSAVSDYFKERERKRKENSGAWHRMFTWLPRKVDESDWRWFEYIEYNEVYTQNCYYSWWDTYYRAIEKK
jgi:hypothetical protein